MEDLEAAETAVASAGIVCRSAFGWIFEADCDGTCCACVWDTDTPVVNADNDDASDDALLDMPIGSGAADRCDLAERPWWLPDDDEAA